MPHWAQSRFMRTAMALNPCEHGEPRGPQACALCRHAAKSGRDQGAAKAAQAAGDWSQRAADTIRQLAATGRPFTADDVTAVCGDPDGHPNAVGAAILRAAKTGLIYKVGTRAASRVKSHKAALFVWQGSRKPEEKEWTLWTT